MQLNLTTDYAIRALLVLHAVGNELSSSEISETIVVEREFTQKILRRLRKAGMVKSTRGKNGGYRLARPLSEITLFDVLSVTEETMKINRCLEKDHFCSRMKGRDLSECQSHRFYTSFQGLLDKIFLNTTLQQIMDGTYKLRL